MLNKYSNQLQILRIHFRPVPSRSWWTRPRPTTAPRGPFTPPRRVPPLLETIFSSTQPCRHRPLWTSISLLLPTWPRFKVGCRLQVHCRPVSCHRPSRCHRRSWTLTNPSATMTTLFRRSFCVDVTLGFHVLRPVASLTQSGLPLELLSIPTDRRWRCREFISEMFCRFGNKMIFHYFPKNCILFQMNCVLNYFWRW